MSDACDLSATVARRLIGAKRLSPVELLSSCIGRIEAVNPAVNAIVTTCFERARAEARAAEAKLMRGEVLGPLHGLPLAVKDTKATEGLRTTYGSPIFADNVPMADDPVVAALRHAGAIVVGKTNTPEFAAGGNTTNPVFGPTGNPYDPSRTVGGSSGGSAAAVALGMVPLATGSDTGGSLRTPAAYCGVCALRPTPGLVADGARRLGWTTFGVEGPLAREVGDLALMLAAQASDDKGDPLSAPVPPDLASLPEVDLARLRVAFSEDLGFAQIDDGIRATFRERRERIAAAFAQSALAHPDLGDADRIFWFQRGVTFLAGYKEHYEQRRDMLGPNVAGNVEAALAMSAADVAFAHEGQTRLYRAAHAFFGAFDLLICPAVSVPAFPVTQLHPTAINGQLMPDYMRWLAITYGLTLTAAAVAVVPCGRDATGLPFGLQIAGPRGSDRFVLGAAAALMRLFAGDPLLAPPAPDLAALAGQAMAGARRP